MREARFAEHPSSPHCDKCAAAERALGSLWDQVPLDAPNPPTDLADQWDQRADRMEYGLSLSAFNQGYAAALRDCARAARGRGWAAHS